MNNWLALILNILPSAIVGIEQVAGHLKGHEKKAAVQDAMFAIAKGVGSIAPQHGPAAMTAASVASSTIDGVVQVLNEAGALAPHKGQADAASA